MTVELSELLSKLVAAKGSDLHLKTGTPPRGRVDGMLHLLSPTPVDNGTMMSYVNAVLNENQRKVLAQNCDIDLMHISEGRRFRVNVFRQDGSIAMVMRVIPSVIPSIDELGLPQVLKEIALTHRGIVLVTGTTGSGKSTTLAAMINHINEEAACNVITIEDPVEFRHKDKRSLVTHRSVGIDVPSFEHALKYVLRQDPDIILIGEMRDKDTIRTAITASETGHLVFSTVHTTDAPQTIERIVATFPTDEQDQVRIQLSTNITAVISQRLLKLPEGGRLAALEIMRSTPTIRKQIFENEIKKLYGTITEGGSDGMQTFNQVLYKFVEENRIDAQTAMAAANRPDELMLELRSNGLT
jgi:twitching motility protein PilT